MKQPFWILNLGLLFLVLCAFIFVYFSGTKIPAREDIEPTPIISQKEHKVAINIKKIYEDDLFGTYIKETMIKKPELVVPFPEPPAQERIMIPRLVEPEFLDPLQVSLKGIIVVGSNDAKNRAIIQEEKTKKETTYKIGDMIQDAQLIRIFKNKVILLRLNGQQEVLYLREQDAKQDPAYTLPNEWGSTVKNVQPNVYAINPYIFVERVTSLGQFIDMLNATTAYYQGKSVGLSIGQLAPGSLGVMLGLIKGDIIITINDTPTETTEQLLSIYKNIVGLTVDDTVVVRLLRHNKEMTISYTLQDFSTSIKNEQQAPEEKPKEEVVQTEAFHVQKNSMQSKNEHYALAPTVNKMRKFDHQMMLEKGKTLG